LISVVIPGWLIASRSARSEMRIGPDELNVSSVVTVLLLT